jgi:hypothetical protein
MADPCAGPSVSTLFIPRKDSLQNQDISKIQEYQDQRANWQAIELWAKQLLVSFSPASTGLVATNSNIPFPTIPSGVATVVPYDFTLWASPPCAVNNTLVVGGVPKSSMASFKLPGVMQATAGVAFNGAVLTAVGAFVPSISLRLHIINTGAGPYDKIIAQQTIPVPVNASGFLPTPKLNVSAIAINVSPDASFYCDVIQNTGTTLNFAGENTCFLSAAMIAPNHEPLNPYL